MTGWKNRVLVEMEDLAHGMSCILEHDGRRVTAIRPAFHRVPMNTCATAGDPLQTIVGMPIGSDFSTFYAGGRARQNCTHMFDLAWLGVVHATRGERVRDYLMEMPDDGENSWPSTLRRDGKVILQWRLNNSTILNPEPFTGRHLFRGFTTWAVETFKGDELEAILVLQKGCFVAQSRRYELPDGPLTAAEQQSNTGLCHGFALERITQAIRLAGTRRDFTEHPVRLLKFI
jgi:hypothetical protein